MIWIIIVLGSLAGGVISAYSRRDRDNIFLRFASSAVPFVCTAGAFYYQYKTGGLQALTGGFRFLSSGGSLATNIVTLVITSAVCVLISKGLGVMIAGYIDSKR